jgi:hypothetical protein
VTLEEWAARNWKAQFGDKTYEQVEAEFERDSELRHAEACIDMPFIHHASHALVYEEPPVCAECGRRMLTGLVPQNICNECQKP